MKKIVVGLLLLSFILVAGCVSYKTYEAPEDTAGQDSLIDEIAQIEEELGLTDDETSEEMNEEEALEEVVEEEVVLEEVTDQSQELLTFTVKENQLIRITAAVEDPDLDATTKTFSSPLDKNGEWKTNYGDAGEYIITITADDGQLTTSQDVKVVVERVNVAPVVTGLKDLTFKEGDLIEINPQVEDPNGDELTVEISEPLSEGVFESDHTSAGEYIITVTADDGELNTQETFMLTIADVNELPQVSDLEPVIMVKEGDTVLIEPTVSDLDEDELTITISEPVGNDGIWETGYTDHGEYMVTVKVNDGKDTVTESVQVVVEDVNMPPQIIDVDVDAE